MCHQENTAIIFSVPFTFVNVLSAFIHFLKSYGIRVVIYLQHVVLFSVIA